MYQYFSSISLLTYISSNFNLNYIVLNINTSNVERPQSEDMYKFVCFVWGFFFIVFFWGGGNFSISVFSDFLIVKIGKFHSNMHYFADFERTTKMVKKMSRLYLIQLTIIMCVIAFADGQALYENKCIHEMNQNNGMF